MKNAMPIFNSGNCFTEGFYGPVAGVLKIFISIDLSYDGIKFGDPSVITVGDKTDAGDILKHLQAVDTKHVEVFTPDATPYGVVDKYRAIYADYLKGPVPMQS